MALIKPLEIKKREIWEFSADGVQFLHLEVYLCYEDEVRTLTIQAREDAVTDDAIDSAAATRIPSDRLWPLPDEDMRRFTGDLSDVYIKGPNVGNYQMVQCTPADLLLQEAAVHERYFTTPHPNIGRYLGYLSGADGRVRGLCFKKYVESLQDRIYLSRDIDGERLVSDIQNGLTFIHERGVVHNDLTPDNIMFDESGTAVIIDYDSCIAQGKPLGAKPGVYFRRNTAEYKNDTDALDEIKRGLVEGFSDVGHTTEAMLREIRSHPTP